MNLNINYYDILNINKNSNSQDIKKAYKKLAIKYHPDKNDNSTEYINKFHKIQEAYDTLNNNKEKYDNNSIYGKNWNNGSFKYSKKATDNGYK